MELYYFGCIDVAGHYWHSVDDDGDIRKYDINRHNELRGIVNGIDGLFVPSSSEGLARINYVYNYTVVSFSDYSVDKRGGCNSNFIIGGIYNYNDAIEIIKTKYKCIYDRFKFEIKEWTPKEKSND